MWSTLLVASMDETFKAAEAYVEWLAPQALPIILEGIARLTAGTADAADGRG